MDPEHFFCDASDEGAAAGLFALMSGLSEEFWAASWLTGLEHSLWQAAYGEQRRFGLGKLSERQCLLLKLLSEEACGWWVWDDRGGDATAKPRFLSLAEWQAWRQ